MMKAGATIIADRLEQPCDWLMEELARRVYQEMALAISRAPNSLRSPS
jgi:hypothetical protein